MEFFEDTTAEQPRIEETIKKYGYAPEHNFYWYQFQAEEGSLPAGRHGRNVFVTGDDGAGLLTIEEREKKRVFIFSSPIAPPARRAPILIEYLKQIFQSSDIEKAVFELETPLRKEFLKVLPAKVKALAINYTLTWPVYDLKMFDPALPGKHWKALRKAKNKFYQKHKVDVVDAKAYNDKKALHSIIDGWRKKRGGRDRAHFSPFHNLIDKDFKGATEARVFIVDGKAVGINAGWLIPNSRRYYGALGIHNYSLPDLGDILYLEDLIWLKAHGYTEADMGGGEGALTDFKKKFQPQSFYKTHIFSVVKT